MVKTWCIIKCTKIVCFGEAAQQFRTSQFEPSRGVFASHWKNLKLPHVKAIWKNQQNHRWLRWVSPQGFYWSQHAPCNPKHCMICARKFLEYFLDLLWRLLKKLWKTFPNHEYQIEKRFITSSKQIQINLYFSPSRGSDISQIPSKNHRFATWLLHLGFAYISLTWICLIFWEQLKNRLSQMEVGKTLGKPPLWPSDRAQLLAMPDPWILRIFCLGIGHDATVECTKDLF